MEVDALQSANEIVDSHEERFKDLGDDPLQLAAIEKGLSLLFEPTLDFTLVSDLVTASLYYEDIYHRRESVYNKTLTVGAKNQFNKKNDFLEIKNDLLMEMSDIDISVEEGMTDEEISVARGEKIEEYMRANLESLTKQIKDLEKDLSL
jgi:hypothetical protein